MKHLCTCEPAAIYVGECRKKMLHKFRAMYVDREVSVPINVVERRCHEKIEKQRQNVELCEKQLESFPIDCE